MIFFFFILYCSLLPIRLNWLTVILFGILPINNISGSTVKELSLQILDFVKMSFSSREKGFGLTRYWRKKNKKKDTNKEGEKLFPENQRKQVQDTSKTKGWDKNLLHFVTSGKMKSVNNVESSDQIFFEKHRLYTTLSFELSGYPLRHATICFVF